MIKFCKGLVCMVFETWFTFLSQCDWFWKDGPLWVAMSYASALLPWFAIHIATAWTWLTYSHLLGPVGFHDGLYLDKWPIVATIFYLFIVNILLIPFVIWASIVLVIVFVYRTRKGLTINPWDYLKGE